MLNFLEIEWKVLELLLRFLKLRFYVTKHDYKSSEYVDNAVLTKQP